MATRRAAWRRQYSREPERDEQKEVGGWEEQQEAQRPGRGGEREGLLEVEGQETVTRQA